MSDQNEPTCFLGLASVRKGTRLIATAGLVTTTVTIIVTVITIIGLITLLDHFKDNLPPEESTTLIIILLLVLIVSLCFMFPSLYFNYLLRKATFDKNVTVVKIWLVLSGMSAILSLILIFLSVLDKGPVNVKIIGLGVHIYSMSVVYRFYIQEVTVGGQEFGIMHA